MAMSGQTTAPPIEEPGLVMSVRGDRAEVQVVPAGGCDHCEAAGVCNWSGKREKTVLALNSIAARPGQRVVLGRTTAAGALSALAVFGLPASLLLAGIIIGSVSGAEYRAAAMGGVGLLLGVVLVRVIDRAAVRSGRGLPVILRVSTDETCKGANDEKSAAGVDGRSDDRD